MKAYAGRGRLQRFAKDESAASALEFALVAGPLIFLLLAVLQVGFVFLGNFVLENATDRAARLVRTGQAQSMSVEAFKTAVCKELSAPLTCGALKLDVRKYNSFSDASNGLTQPFDGKGNLKNNFSYNPGGRGDVMVVRAFYPLDIGSYLPYGAGLGNMNNGSGDRLLVATAAFRNEPF